MYLIKNNIKKILEFKYLYLLICMFFTANSVFSKNLKNISDTISIQDSSKQKINLTRSPQELYATCSQCHTIGKGKLIGPDLLNVDERHNILWISNFINNSDSLIKSGDTTAIKLFNSNEKIPMPKHDFDSTEISNLVNYIIIEGNKLKVNPNFLDNPKSFLPKSNNWLIIIGIFLVLLSVFDIFFTKFLRLKIIHVLLIFIGIGIIGKIVYQEATYLGRSLGYEPDQPIKFSHKQHAGDNKIDCIYCHTGVNNSRYASIPPESICLNCHNVITNGTNTGEEEINKLHQYVDNNEPIKWIKVYNLPDYVFFSHAQHVKVAKLNCDKCHGDVKNMGRIQQVNDLSMGWCINCHRQTKVDFNNKYYSNYKQQKDYKSGKILKVTVEDIGGNNCEKCHY